MYDCVYRRGWPNTRLTSYILVNRCTLMINGQMTKNKEEKEKLVPLRKLNNVK